ncbi:unnamed protein product [Miscanthus lutarioriparius]|uniref:PDZ domain-containing protein n=1 Tax=Miscanthus lutarioriparius TaxID=422564 RepID=A0A811RXC0_9POAL|nr:unnamed protein product [Miscanthus lutarioriparius]
MGRCATGKVLIHLLDDTIQKGTLINYQKHYNITLFEVVVKMSAELPLSTELIEYGQEFGTGGSVIDTKGGVLGMANPTPRAAFIPTPLILRCLRMWRDLKCVPRLHLGLKVSSIKFLHSSHKEKISRKFNINAGLIVQEVSEGSAAEKIGIRNGDVIESLNEKCFPTTVELEIMLLRTCEHCVEKGGGLGSNVDLTVGLFQTRKEKRCTKKLTLNVSDDLEVIAGAIEGKLEKEDVDAVAFAHRKIPSTMQTG